MNKLRLTTKAIINSLTLFCLLAVSAQLALAQRPGGMPQQRDVLAGLKHALEDAGAPALSAQQEDQLEALIQAFREANQQGGPPASVEAARRAFDAAILAGNLAQAQNQAQLIANAIGAGMNSRLQAQAKFQIDALNVLKTNAAQVNALTARFGSAGITRLLASLAGGPQGGPGGGRPQGGPGGGPQGGPGGGRPRGPQN